LGPAASVSTKIEPMNELGFLPILLGVCIVLAAGTLAYLGWRMERRRTEALVSLAARLGMNFSPERDRELAARFKALRGLHEGNDRYAWNVLSGPYGGSPFMVFDFHYETESTDSEGRRQTSHHYLHAVLLELPRTFPNLHVSPEGMFSKSRRRSATTTSISNPRNFPAATACARPTKNSPTTSAMPA
jgi:hypothetical protein